MTSYWEPAFTSRMRTIALHAQSVGLGKTLLAGESNTESFWWSQVNGRNVINAGINAIPLAEYASRAGEIAYVTQPSNVHIMCGAADYDTPKAEAAASYGAIIDAFAAYTSKIVLYPVPPVDASQAASYPQDKRKTLNDMILEVGFAKGLVQAGKWDWHFPSTLTTGALVAGTVTDGYALAGKMNSDGVHFSQATQLARYHRLNDWFSVLAV